MDKANIEDGGCRNYGFFDVIALFNNSYCNSDLESHMNRI